MNLLKVRFSLKPSPSLGVLFLSIHLGAIFGVVFANIWVGVKLGLIFFVLMNLVAVIRVYVLYGGRSSVIEFGSIGAREWGLKLFSGKDIVSGIKHPVFLSNYLIIINFISNGRGFSRVVLIAKDSLSEDSFRKLKVLLKTMS